MSSLKTCYWPVTDHAVTDVVGRGQPEGSAGDYIQRFSSGQRGNTWLHDEFNQQDEKGRLLMNGKSGIPFFLVGTLVTYTIIIQLAAAQTSGLADSPPVTQSVETCLVCRRCPNSINTQTPDSCLLCKACSAPAQASTVSPSVPTVSVGSQPAYQPVTVQPAAADSKPPIPPEWRTHSRAIDLHFESGAVFRGFTVGACVVDIDTGSISCQDSGRTHVAASIGATYWLKPSLGLSLDTVILDAGTVAGLTGTTVGGYFGVQFQRPSGAIRPYLEVAPGYMHSFTTGSADAILFNPDLASVKAGGGVRFLVRRRWGVKMGVDVLPSFSGISHLTPITFTAGWFWQSKGKGGTE
jgi:hypothetical protein